MIKNKDNYEITEIVAEFKSKNKVPLIAYNGIWKGANGNQEIHYIETLDRKYVGSFNVKKEYSWDKTLDEEIDYLSKTLILDFFERTGVVSEDGYLFSGYGAKIYDIDKITNELKLLISEKVRIGFNEDWGVGTVHYSNDSFLIELWVYGNMSIPLKTKDLRDIAKWLLSFSDSNDKEPFDECKAMSVAFTKDAMTEEEREKEISRKEEFIKKELQNIK